MNSIELEGTKAKVVELPRVPAGQVWEVCVHITFPVLPADITERYEGDAEVDFASRAFERLQPHLQKLADEAGAGYHAAVRAMKRCY